MGEPLNVGELTAEARHAIVLLRHAPQSLHGLAETLGLNPEQTQNVLQGGHLTKREKSYASGEFCRLEVYGVTDRLSEKPNTTLS